MAQVRQSSRRAFLSALGLVETSVPERLRNAFVHSRLSAAEQEMIARGDTLRLLQITWRRRFVPSGR